MQDTARRLAGILVVSCGTMWCNTAVGQNVTVYRVVLNDQVQLSDLRTVERAVREASDAAGAALVLEINASDGHSAIAQLIAEAIAGARLPVFAMVMGRAWQGAALIALAADSTYMRPNASIGAAPSAQGTKPRLAGQDAEALRRALTPLLARRGVDPRIASAMVADTVAMEGLVDRGSLLTLMADQAVRIGLAVAEVDSLGEMLARVGLQAAAVKTIDNAWTATTVRVTNANWRDITVYVVRGLSRYRVGTVTSMNSAEYIVPTQSLPIGAEFSLVAEVVGSGETVGTQPFDVEPGLVVEWHIENMLSQSSVFAFIRS